MLAVVSLAQFLGMTLWFSATAVTPLLIAEFNISESHAAWLTMGPTALLRRSRGGSAAQSEKKEL